MSHLRLSVRGAPRLIFKNEMERSRHAEKKTARERKEDLLFILRNPQASSCGLSFEFLPVT